MALQKAISFIGGAELDGLDDVALAVISGGIHGVAELVEGVGNQGVAFHRFPHHLGSEEETLEKKAVLVKAGAAAAANAGGGESAEGHFHQIFPSGQVAAGGGDRATGVFDHRSGHQIHTDGCGFPIFHKFPVAVIDKTNGVGVL
jgi:hypothetical protein